MLLETMTNQAFVTFSYEGATETKTNSSNTVTSSIRDKYSLSVEKISTTECFRAGENISYIVTVRNTGCDSLCNFSISDNLGGEENLLSYVEGSARLFINGGMQVITPSSTSSLDFDIPDRLGKSESFVLQFNAHVNADISSEILEITNTVTVRAYPCGCDCNCSTGGVISETATATVPKCEFAEVLITKAITNDNVCCGEEVDYLITLTNTGSVDATNVVVTDQLPESFTTMDIRMENNGNHYVFEKSEYDIDETNLLTLPNETGTVILVPSIAPGVDNTTRIVIHGHM